MSNTGLTHELIQKVIIADIHSIYTSEQAEIDFATLNQTVEEIGDNNPYLPMYQVVCLINVCREDMRKQLTKPIEYNLDVIEHGITPMINTPTIG